MTNEEGKLKQTYLKFNSLSEQDDWVSFQNEIDSVRDVVLMYKTKPCNLNCKNADCFFYHNSQEKRRKPFSNDGKLVYFAELCSEGDLCNSLLCSRSHNFYELNYHPWKFKTKPCESYFQSTQLGVASSNSVSRCDNTTNTNSGYSNNVNTSGLFNDYPLNNIANKSNLNNSNNNNTNTSFTSTNTRGSISLKEIKSLTNHNEKLCPYYHNKSQMRETGKGNKITKTQTSNLSSPDSIINRFDLNIFKVFKCNNNNKHSEKQCIYYHSSKDRRRSQNQFYYLPEICFSTQSDQKCSHAEYCNKSHNQVEMFYHKEKFRTKFCSHYLETKKLKEVNNDCPYGSFCSFAHCESEIRIDLIHKMDKNMDFFMYYFKTIVCPFDHKHDKSICEYSHNLQDYRRNPKKHIYEKKNCIKWDNKKTILFYSDGCPEGYGCIHSHGWKELDFHPLNYKTIKCKNYRGNCEKGSLCPFYHNFENKR